MNNKLKYINLINELSGTFLEVEEQLKKDEKKLR